MAKSRYAPSCRDQPRQLSSGKGLSRHADLVAAVRNGSYNPPVEDVTIAVMAWLCDLGQSKVPRAGLSLRAP